MAVSTKTRKAVQKANKKLKVLKVEYVSVADVQPNNYNPNRQAIHEFMLLLRSIDEDGFTQPVVGQEELRQIVDGEHRWAAAIVLNYLYANNLPIEEKPVADARKKLGEIIDPSVQIPIVWTNMDRAQMMIATLRHNRAKGSEDMALSAEVLRDLKEIGALEWAQHSLDLDDVEIKNLLDVVDAPEALAGDDWSDAWVPAPAESAGSTPGEGNVHGISPRALTAIRNHEERLAGMRKQSDREQARKDLAVHRVTLIFEGDEAILVRQVLGEAPAVKLLEMCLREAKANHG